MYTKGKWFIHRMATVLMVKSSDRTIIADVYNRETKEEMEANAQLIASAPELLEACKRAKDFIVSEIEAFGDSDILSWAEDTLEQAINKAEGKE